MRKAILVLVMICLVAGCGPSGAEDATTSSQGAITTTTADAPPTTNTTQAAAGHFPVVVDADNGSVTIDEEPTAIVSLSSVATEMLFEIGAGPQVVAVDDQSNYPADAPTTDLSGFTPNLEAILSYSPDLVVISYDPGDLVAGLETAGVNVLSYGAAGTIDDVYRQIGALGAATGNGDTAVKVNEGIRADLSDIVDGAGGSGEGVSYYHEVDATYYTVTSSTFFGAIYGLFGMVNIADPADADGSAFGYPQLSSEFIVSADPDIIFLADSLYGENAETVAARPGWGALSAVQSGDIVTLDSDVASRWGPRIVDLARAISDGLGEYGAD